MTLQWLWVLQRSLKWSGNNAVDANCLHTKGAFTKYRTNLDEVTDGTCPVGLCRGHSKNTNRLSWSPHCPPSPTTDLYCQVEWLWQLLCFRKMYSNVITMMCWRGTCRAFSFSLMRNMVSVTVKQWRCCFGRKPNCFLLYSRWSVCLGKHPDCNTKWNKTASLEHCI